MNKRPEGKALFKVSIVSDTHVNEREDFSASPYPANAEANPRARHVFAQINAVNPAFVIHLGDMINPVPELPSYVEAAQEFHNLAKELKAPLHMVPGNHDIGDKPVSWMPAGMVCGEYIALYRKHFGKDYFAIKHEDCHFIVINSPLINSGDPAEEEQRIWLEGYLAAHRGKRMFLFSHYPIYVSDPAEPESYDNIGQPGRGWLLGLIRDYKPEAVFTAHVHNFWYDVIGETEYYVLPSTCFVRHDYAEMYRIDGGDQKGRNDAAKLGFLTLDVHEKGHVAHYHRSYGATLAPGAELADPVVARPHAKTSRPDNIFVDMRHGWAEEMTVAPSGAVDEFRRKIARNDYPVMALWEMGLRGLRVPIQDLMDPRIRRRMELMAGVGSRFQVYLYGMPDKDEAAMLGAHAGLVSQLELVLGWDQVPALSGEIRALKQATGLRIILSRVNRKDGAKHSGGRFNHLISHGFTLSELDELEAFLSDHPGLVDGIQFTAPRSECPWASARALSGFAGKTGTRPVLYVKSTEASPAEEQPDEIANAERFALAMMAGIGTGVDVVLDTLDDADRGYFTRTGLIDRRFNPRLAGQLLSAIVETAGPRDWRARETPGYLSEAGTGRTLRVVRAGDLAGAGGRWICPETGRSGPANDDSRRSSSALLLMEEDG
ncbi:Calcineurin-like phosphoesterase [Paracoccus halophilus]|uniref:Calcineurin-like phosphoesterase n=1 Tax=Paracoccus halophilus TaxID=376733 RepID=A0A1I0TZC4_9RHOB|nr:metallophosphoesterase [Paracoccus halophilus]SFA57211.1 Calcineurin-like phosphoesterase [Paracoccus halophilus]